MNRVRTFYGNFSSAVRHTSGNNGAPHRHTEASDGDLCVVADKKAINSLKINTVICLCAMGDEVSNFRGSRTGVSSPEPRMGKDQGRTEIRD